MMGIRGDYRVCFFQFRGLKNAVMLNRGIQLKYIGESVAYLTFCSTWARNRAISLRK